VEALKREGGEVESRGREGGNKAKRDEGRMTSFKNGWMWNLEREWGDVFPVMVLTGHDGISVVSCLIKSFLENWRSLSL
jgi:hypothetical protein